jgi:hypothetical protein
MKYLFVALAVLIGILSIRCTNEALRSKEKFSRTLKYAMLPFNCPDKELGENLSTKVKEWLSKDDYQFINEADFDRILMQKKLTRQEIVANYFNAVGELRGVDGIIIGETGLDKKLAKSENAVNGAGSGTKSFISRCNVMVIDVSSGDVLANVAYNQPLDDFSSGTQSIDYIGRKIALLLSPH